MTAGARSAPFQSPDPRRHAQGCAYATYVGSWKSRFRILEGEDLIGRYEDAAAATTRSFCTRCGAPLFYERARSPKIVNIPRALFATRTGRETRYHMNLDQMADWTWRGEPMVPLKGYPGVMWVRPKAKARSRPTLPADSLFEPEPEAGAADEDAG